MGRGREAVGSLPIRVHFHNTRNTGLAKVWAAVTAGAATVDASLGGLGGCPFAPGAAGNVPTEDVAYLLERSGVTTGLDPFSPGEGGGGVGGGAEKSRVGEEGVRSGGCRGWSDHVKKKNNKVYK